MSKYFFIFLFHYSNIQTFTIPSSTFGINVVPSVSHSFIMQQLAREFCSLLHLYRMCNSQHRACTQSPTQFYFHVSDEALECIQQQHESRLLLDKYMFPSDMLYFAQNSRYVLNLIRRDFHFRQLFFIVESEVLNNKRLKSHSQTICAKKNWVKYINKFRAKNL